MQTAAADVFEVGSEQDPNVAAAREIKLAWRMTEDNVLVFPLEKPGKTQGGVLLPDQAREKPLQGVVVAVGPGKPRSTGGPQEADFKPGDVVRYQKYAGSLIDVEHAGRKYEMALLKFEHVRMVRTRS